MAFTAALLCPAAAVVAGEWGLIPNGIVAEKSESEFNINMAVILATLILVPLSLKLFRLNTTQSLRRYTFDDALRTYRVWSVIRLVLMSLASVVGTVAYYLTLNTTGLLCAAVAFLLLWLCFPTASRIHHYLEHAQENQE